MDNNAIAFWAVVIFFIAWITFWSIVIMGMLLNG